MPKVSIIVPICNVAAYLPACLDSLIAQTLQDIEIICIDDFSADASADILRQYAARDSRIVPVFYPENKTAAQARKDGALLAKGEYILFVDGDDRLAPRACEDLSRLMDETGVDMLHFGTRVEAAPEVDPQRAARLEKMLLPCLKPWGKESILDACFVKKRFHFQLWNKIYRRDLCRKAFSLFPDGAFSKAQDLFAFYLLAYFARSYRAIETPYYVYGFGRGVTGQNHLTRGSILRYCQQALVVQGIREFLVSQGTLEAHQDSLACVDRQLFTDSFMQVTKCASREDFPYAYEEMCRYWGAERVICRLSEAFSDTEDDLARLLTGMKSPTDAPRPIRRIGTLYHSIRNGGAQRVAAMLCELWRRMGYEVVLFTEQPATPQDYPLPDGVTRVIVPEFARETAAQRIRLLQQKTAEYQLDLFIHQAWVSPAVMWDLLAVRSAGAQFMMHTHNVFSMPLHTTHRKKLLCAMPPVYALADGVITLSRADEAYWRHFNPRVFLVKNPLTFDCTSLPQSPLDGQTILWLSRISVEKNPDQAIEIMAKVHKQCPDARLRIVGSGEAYLEKYCRRRTEVLGLTNCIEFCGFQQDVEPFYRDADLFLCTSSYEGYPLILAEAQSHGLPCVVYDMPYLTILESGQGSISVPQNDVEEAARQVIRLLKDESLRKETGCLARKNVETSCTVDMEAQWRSIFTAAEVPANPLAENDPRRIMMTTLLDHLQRGILDNPLYTGKKSPLAALSQRMRQGVTYLKTYGLTDTVKKVFSVLTRRK